jgi:formylglycine-generating enzyme required for sulfatase activity
MTQGQWVRAVGRNPSDYDPQHYSAEWNRFGLKADLVHPVEQVSWNDCTEVLRRLGLELPSEAQWEYGARAGTTTVWWTGNDKRNLADAGNVLDNYAQAHGGAGWGNHELDLDDGNSFPARVGSYRANAFGLHEVIGNVWEWCRDGYRQDFYLHAPKKDPISDPAGCSYCTYRGGGFFHPAMRARSGNRDGATPGSADGFVGCRPARRIAP